MRTLVIKRDSANKNVKISLQESQWKILQSNN